MQKSRRQPQWSETLHRFRKRKSCCDVIAIPSGWNRCPNPNYNARFWSKRKTASCIFFPIPCTAYCSIPRNCNPRANWTRVRWLEAEHDNHYTVLLATMQWQNVVFKPNVWEKGNRGSCLNVVRYVTCAWVASTVCNPCANQTRVRWLEGKGVNHYAGLATMQR